MHCRWRVHACVGEDRRKLIRSLAISTAISGDLLSAVISIRYIFGFRKDNPNVFNSLIQSWPHF
jgi:hypothetical protein